MFLPLLSLTFNIHSSICSPWFPLYKLENSRIHLECNILPHVLQFISHIYRFVISWSSSLTNSASPCMEIASGKACTCSLGKAELIPSGWSESATALQWGFHYHCGWRAQPVGWRQYYHKGGKVTSEGVGEANFPSVRKVCSASTGEIWSTRK